LRTARRAAGAHVDVVAMERDVELPELELDAGALLDEPAEPVRDRDAARVDADERDRVELVVPLDDLVRDAGERPAELLLVQQDSMGRAYGRVRHATPFRPHRTGLKGDVPQQHTRSGRTESSTLPGRGRRPA